MIYLKLNYFSNTSRESTWTFFLRICIVFWNYFNCSCKKLSFIYIYQRSASSAYYDEWTTWCKIYVAMKWPSFSLQDVPPIPNRGYKEDSPPVHAPSAHTIHGMTTLERKSGKLKIWCRLLVMLNLRNIYHKSSLIRVDPKLMLQILFYQA